MFYKMEYFVLALFLNAVASNPYHVLKNSSFEEHYNTKDLNHELNVARNEEVYLPRDEISYMSPLPTKRDGETRILQDPQDIGKQSIVTNYENERNIEQIRENIPDYNYRLASSRTNNAAEVSPIPDNVVNSGSYSNPSSVVDENGLLSRLLPQTKPVVNSIVSQLGVVNENQPKIEKRDLEVLSRYETHNNQQPLRIQARPEKRIAFQQPVVPDRTNLETYRLVTPVQKFDVNREWTKISKEEAHLPEWLTQRLKYPVDVPYHSQLSASNIKKPDLQKIINDPRIHNVITSTRQRKRYMVIYPNGTVEHFDRLEPISEKHPNYVLVNAGQFLNNHQTKVLTNENKPISTQSETILLNSKPYKPVENTKVISRVEVISNKVAGPTLPTATVIKKVKSSEPINIPELSVASSSATVANIGLPSTITTEIKQLTKPIEKPQVVIEVIPKKVAVQTVPPTIVEKVTPSQPTIIAVPTVASSSASVAEIAKSTKPIENPQAAVEIIPKKEAVQTVTSIAVEKVTASGPTRTPTPEPSAASSSTVANIVPHSAIIPKTTVKTENTNETVDTPIEITDESVKNSNTSNAIISNNETDQNIADAEPITTDVTTTAKINESTHDATTLVETTPSSEIIKLGIVNSFTLENVKESEVVHSIQNVKKEDDQANEVKESSKSGKPQVFDTADPDFWKKVTEGRDTDSIFFFLFKSGPRVEKNTVRTVFPDGSVLEELTETLWEEAGAEPKITKSSKVIPPGDL